MFVLTHQVRDLIEMPGGAAFHFINSPAGALETARKAAGGQDIRIGGRGVCEPGTAWRAWAKER